MATTRRYREGLRERLGMVPARLKAAVAGKRVLWVHAVSLGEVLAVSRLVRELESALPSSAEEETGARPWLVVISTTTRTGQNLARERFGAERVFYFPLDLGWAVRAYLRALEPEMLLLAESELWPRMLHECQRAEVRVSVANARVSDRSFRRGRYVRPLWRPVLRKVTLWLTQSEEDGQRLVKMGARPETVRHTGNLKYDSWAMAETPMSRRFGALLQDTRLVIAGSTLEGEESLFLEAWLRLRAVVPGTVLLLGPRHPERFDRVLALIGSYGLPAFRCSQLMVAPEPIPAGAVLLLDTIGDLAAMYGLADVAFIGASLVSKGGHNPLEPARFGVPVVMGPSFENFRDIVAKMQALDGIRVLAGRDELEPVLRTLLTDREAARQMGARGREIFAREDGASARSLAEILPLLREPVRVSAPEPEAVAQ